MSKEEKASSAKSPSAAPGMTEGHLSSSYVNEYGGPRFATPSGSRDLLNDPSSSDYQRHHHHHQQPSPAHPRSSRAQQINLRYPHPQRSQSYASSPSIASLQHILDDPMPTTPTPFTERPEEDRQPRVTESEGRSHDTGVARSPVRLAYHASRDRFIPHDPREHRHTHGHSPRHQHRIYNLRSTGDQVIDEKRSSSLSPTRTERSQIGQSHSPRSMNVRRTSGLSSHAPHRPPIDQPLHQYPRSAGSGIYRSHQRTIHSSNIQPYHPFGSEDHRSHPNEPPPMMGPTLSAENRYPPTPDLSGWAPRVPSPISRRRNPAQAWFTIGQPATPRDIQGWNPEQLRLYDMGFEDAIRAVEAGVIGVHGQHYRHPILVRHDIPDAVPQPPFSAREAEEQHRSYPPAPGAGSVAHHDQRYHHIPPSYRPHTYPYGSRSPLLPQTPHDVRPYDRPYVLPPPYNTPPLTRHGMGHEPHGHYFEGHYPGFGTGPPSSSSAGIGPGRGERQPISCFPCRHRKLKCDGGKPCGQCVKRGTVESCAYANYIRRRGKGKKHKSGSGGESSEGSQSGGGIEMDRMEGRTNSTERSGFGGPGGTRMMSEEEPLAEIKQEEQPPLSSAYPEPPEISRSSTIDDREWRYGRASDMERESKREEGREGRREVDRGGGPYDEKMEEGERSQE